MGKFKSAGAEIENTETEVKNEIENVEEETVKAEDKIKVNVKTFAHMTELHWTSLSRLEHFLKIHAEEAVERTIEEWKELLKKL